MSDTYTVCFFGHRTVRQPALIKERLEKIVGEIIRTKENIKFLVGEDSFFDIMCSFTVKDFMKKYDEKKVSLVLVLPRFSAYYRENPEHFLNFYDEVEVCDEPKKAYFKSVMVARNKNLIDRSDLVVCYYWNGAGEANKTLQYVRAQQKNIINIADD